MWNFNVCSLLPCGNWAKIWEREKIQLCSLNLFEEKSSKICFYFKCEVFATWGWCLQFTPLCVGISPASGKIAVMISSITIQLYNTIIHCNTTIQYNTTINTIIHYNHPLQSSITIIHWNTIIHYNTTIQYNHPLQYNHPSQYNHTIQYCNVYSKTKFFQPL